MSSLFGIVDLRGGLPSREDLEAMARALPGNPDGLVYEAHGSALLGHRRGSLASRDAWVAVASGRLDNAPELGAALDIPVAHVASESLAQLCLQACRRWGLDCADRMEGDWAFAAWDPRSRTLTILRDHHGNTALYWHAGEGRLAFASSLGPLLALAWVPRKPDLFRVAQILTAWSGDGVRTAYEGIQALPPGHGLEVRDGQARLFRHWIPENLPALEGLSDEAYAERFLEAYASAVRRRVAGPGAVGILLSAGLDSGSVAVLAGPELRQQGRGLTALTAVPSVPAPGPGPEGILLDEGGLAAATARWAQAEHVRVDAAAVGFLEALDRQVELHAQPCHAAANAPWLLAALAEARELGLAVLLTGQQGNATVSHAGNASLLFPALLEGHLDLAWRSFRQAESNAAAALRWQVVRPLLAPLRRTFRSLARGGAPWAGYAALNPELAAEVRLGERMAEEGHDPAFGRPARRGNVALLDPGRNAAGAFWHELGEAFGLEVRDPTVDRRLAEFCLRCPELQYRRGGEGRWLLRRAFAGRLPPEVLHGRLFGRQSADLGVRALAERDAIRARLADLARHPLAARCLDLAEMSRVLEALSPGNAWTSYGAVGGKLARGLAVGAYLSRF